MTLWSVACREAATVSDVLEEEVRKMPFLLQGTKLRAPLQWDARIGFGCAGESDHAASVPGVRATPAVKAPPSVSTPPDHRHLEAACTSVEGSVLSASCSNERASNERRAISRWTATVRWPVDARTREHRQCPPRGGDGGTAGGQHAM
eukprot:ctg_2360.g509